MRVLWIGDAVIQSGFSTVTKGICTELVKNCDLTVFGIGYNGRIKNKANYYVYAGADRADIYSFNSASEIVAKDNYDVVVLFNDLPVVLAYARYIRKQTPKLPLVAIFPVNTPPVPSKEVIELSNLDVCEVMTYTDAAKNHIASINPNLSITSIYHGVNKKVFSRDNNCRQQAGLKDLFVAGYVGSNTYRKRLDLLLEGFAKFAKGKNDVRCLLHVNNLESSYPLTDMALYYGIKDKVLFSCGNIPDERIKLLYSVMDVNINTSIGEGFGLPLLEGASCGTPILCAKHDNLVDIWGDTADYIEIDRREFIPDTNYLGSVISTDNLADKLSKLYDDRNYLKQRSVDVLNRSIDPRFDWRVVSDKVYKAVSSATRSRVNIIV